MALLERMKLISKSVLFFAFGLMLGSCTSEYTELVRQELSSGIEYDSILLGNEFGDQHKDFFTKAWTLNKDGLVRQGPKNQTIQYDLVAEYSTRSSIRFLFYPNFDEDERIKEMELTIDYQGWSPWTNLYKSDSLPVAMRDTIMQWYGGNEFFV